MGDLTLSEQRHDPRLSQDMVNGWMLSVVGAMANVYRLRVIGMLVVVVVVVNGGMFEHGDRLLIVIDAAVIVGEVSRAMMCCVLKHEDERVVGVKLSQKVLQ